MTHSEEERCSPVQIDFVDKKMEQAAPIEHSHDQYEIAFFLKANVQIFVSDSRYDIRDGDLLLIRPFDIHRIFYHPDFHYSRFVIYFDKKEIHHLLDQIQKSTLLEEFDRRPDKKISLSLKQQGRIEQICREMLDESRLPQPNRAAIQLLLGMLLIRMKEWMDTQKQHYRHQKKDQKVRQLIEYIDSHYWLPLRLDELEDATGTNKYHLSHLFKEVTGMTIIEYLQNRRVVEARKLLAQTNMPIVDIGFESGFQSPQHFGRVFKQLTGTTPARYRRNHGS